MSGMRFAALAIFGTVACVAVAGNPKRPSDTIAQDGSSTAVNPDGQTSTEDGGATPCAPGQQIACACPGGSQGAQVCRGDGAGYEPCDCPDDTSTSDGGSEGADESTHGTDPVDSFEPTSDTAVSTTGM